MLHGRTIKKHYRLLLLLQGLCFGHTVYLADIHPTSKTHNPHGKIYLTTSTNGIIYLAPYII